MKQKSILSEIEEMKAAQDAAYKLMDRLCLAAAIVLVVVFAALCILCKSA